MSQLPAPKTIEELYTLLCSELTSKFASIDGQLKEIKETTDRIDQANNANTYKIAQFEAELNKHKANLPGMGPVNSTRLYEFDQVGVINALSCANTVGSGGYILPIEVVVCAQKSTCGGSIKYTGCIQGESLESSIQVAHTFAKNYLRERNLFHGATFLDNNDLHLHIAPGDFMKSGPSAGCAFATAIISLALGIKLSSKLAITGEITLTGKVLGVGGIMQKLSGAQVAGITTVYLPEAVRNECINLEGLQLIFVSNYDQIFTSLFQS